jgi:chloramphenicol O-acetyltransferase
MTKDYTKKRLSPFRLLSIYGYEAIGAGHNMYALIELDVTELRKSLRMQRKNGQNVSFFAYLLSAIAKSIDEHKELNHIRKGKNIYYFKEIDIDIPIEFEVNGVNEPRKYIVRNAASKTVTEITQEIDTAKNNWKIEGNAGTVDKWGQRWIYFASVFPSRLFKMLIKHFSKNPFLTKKGFGTTYVSSVSGFSDIPGFVIPYFAGSNRPLAFAIGNVVKKPGIVGSEIKVRDFLSMTISINHDLVDGAPAARFINRLKNRIEENKNWV